MQEIHRLPLAVRVSQSMSWDHKPWRRCSGATASRFKCAASSPKCMMAKAAIRCSRRATTTEDSGPEIKCCTRASVHDQVNPLFNEIAGHFRNFACVRRARQADVCQFRHLCSNLRGAPDYRLRYRSVASTSSQEYYRIQMRSGPRPARSSCPPAATHDADPRRWSLGRPRHSGPARWSPGYSECAVHRRVSWLSLRKKHVG